MSAPFVIPFNFKPSGVSVKTASYTIPSGKYAQVYVECDSGGIFTIDGVGAVVTAAFVNIATYQVNNITTASYTVPTNFKAAIFGFSNDATTRLWTAGSGSSVIPQSTQIANGPFFQGPGQTNTINLSSTATKGFSGLAEPSNALNRQATFWVTAGTVLSGSGNWKAVVMEFNNIT
jgi:hypothetical protein